MTEPPHKPFWTSKTIIAAIVILVCQVAAFFGAHVTESESTETVELTAQLISGIAAIVAIIGRVIARQQIGTSEPPGGGQ